MHAQRVVTWRCEKCGLGPFSIRAHELPVHHACGEVVIDTLECQHRSHVIGEHICEVCGMRGQVALVYRCERLAAPCVLRPWTNLRRKMDGETSCVTCRERTLPDGSRPWSE